MVAMIYTVSGERREGGGGGFNVVDNDFSRGPHSNGY
jgi:hypothetical protein